MSITTRRDRGKPALGSARGDRAGGVPWQVCLAIAMLGFEGVGNLLNIPSEPANIYWLAAKCLFMVGLALRWAWVFVLLLAVAGLHVAEFAARAPFVAGLNLALMLLVGSAHRYYFPKGRGGAGAAFVPGDPMDREFLP